MTREEQLKFRDLWKIDLYGEELPLIKCLNIFFNSLKNGSLYDYEKVIKELGSEMLGMATIALLDSYGYIEYGTSIRYGWITEEMKVIKEYFDRFAIDELYEALWM